MYIREAKTSDAREISRVMKSAIKSCSKDYTKRQINAWLACDTYNEVKKKIKKGGDRFIILFNNKITGYGTINKRKRKIGNLYILKKFQKHNIGSKLLKFLEKYAKKLGIKRLFLYSTLTAFDFYIKKGYTKLRKHNAKMKNVLVPNIIMYRYI